MSDDIPTGALDVDKPPEADARLYAVTTIIKASTSNEALIFWSAEETAKCAVGSMKTLYAMIENQGEPAAIDWLKEARYRGGKNQRSSTDLGTEFHRLAEEYSLTGERPACDDEMRPYLDQFDGLLQKLQPEVLAAEMTVYHALYGYAGTLDAVWLVNGVPYIIDYKSSKKSRDKKGNPTTPYPEAGLQLAAYRFAEFGAAWRVRRWENFRRRYYLLGPDERQMAVPIPKVEGGLVIHVTPEHCNAHPMRCDEAVHERFLYKIESAVFELEMARTIVGDPLALPEVAA